MGPSPLGCVSLSRCPWVREVSPGCQSWGVHRAAMSGRAMEGVPMQMVRCAPSHQPTRFPCSGCCCQSVIPYVSPVHGPCSLASGSGVWGLGKEASHPQGPKCFVEPRIMPSPSSFPNMLFSRSLGQTLFLMVFVGVERMCLFRFLLLYFKVRFLGPHSKLLGYFSHGADRVDSNYWCV